MRPLAVVPSFAREDRHLVLLATCLRTLTRSDIDVLVVDDGSLLQDETLKVAVDHGVEFVARGENGGFSKAVNVGLQRALDEGRDAVLVNSDVEFTEDGWLEELQKTDAQVVGALLLYPFGRVQSAGSYFSSLTRGWQHRFHWAPRDVEELHVEAECPCTAALQLVRHEALEVVGLYDEEFRLAFEDVDHALRVFDSGGRCVYQPRAVAVHHEHATRGDGAMSDMELASWRLLYRKYDGRDLSRFEWPPR